MTNTNECDHFWDLVFPITDITNQMFECIHCKIKRKMQIPILDLEEFEKQELCNGN